MLSTEHFSKTISGLNKKAYEEIITTHNISILMLIRIYFDIRKDHDRLASMVLSSRRGFSTVIQKLLQCPDLSYREFLETISDKQYNLPSDIIENFQILVHRMLVGNADMFMCYIGECKTYLMDTVTMYSNIKINRTSPVGIFFRRMIVFFDKLTFSQTIKVYRLFHQYYLAGNPNATLNILSVNMVTSNTGNESKMEVTMTASPSQETNCSVLHPILELLGIGSIPESPEKLAEYMSWSRRQTELFLVQQSTLLQYDEPSALSPSILQQQINEIIEINPEYSEAYYLSYLNCLRVNEYNGAKEHLHKYFDSECTAFKDDKHSNYRYAALNLAILHTQFDNKVAALAALKECLMLSHASNDFRCLYIAYAWYRYLQDDKEDNYLEYSWAIVPTNTPSNRKYSRLRIFCQYLQPENLQKYKMQYKNVRTVIDRADDIISKCDEVTMYSLSALGLQTYSVEFLFKAQPNDTIFQLLDRSDLLSMQHTMYDLQFSSLAVRAAVLESYGRSTVSSLVCQRMLSISTTSGLSPLKRFNTEGLCIALCVVANNLTLEGKYQMAEVIFSHCKERFPNKYSKWWKLCEQILFFERALNLDLWTIAHNAAVQIAAVDKNESILRLGRMWLARGERQVAYECVQPLFSSDKNGICPMKKLRAYIIAAQATQANSFSLLIAAMAIATDHSFMYFEALIKLEMAKLQFQMGFVTEAMKLLDQCSVVILSEKKMEDRASLFIMQARCKMAYIGRYQLLNLKENYFQSAIELLESAKMCYKHLDCTSKVKDVLYLQALAANEIKDHDKRNKFSFDFKKLDEQNPTSTCSINFSVVY